MLNVRREDFIPPCYRDHAYEEIPLPLPGERTAISCPHSYPLFYEPLGLSEGYRFLEVGVGSGYGTSLAREVVGPEGLVVAIDIDATTFAFARGCRISRARRPASERRREMSRSKGFWKVAETNQSPGSGPLHAAVDICDSLARENLERAGYTDIVLVEGDGGLGYPAHAPYDAICITAACPAVPPPR